MKRVSAILLLALVLMVTHSSSYAERFRIRKTIMVAMPESGNISVQAGINDAMAISLPQDTTFLQGIELDIKIPDVLSRYYGSVAYSLYTSIFPKPEANIINYTGTREMIDTIPGRLSLNLMIPLKESHTIQQTPYSQLLPLVYTLGTASIFFRFQLVMKGIPEDYEHETFDVTVKPIYESRGRLQLDVRYPQDENQRPMVNPFTVFIDEEMVTLHNQEMILDAGTHHLTIISDFYRNETRTFEVETAKTTQLQVQLRDIAPTLQLLAPENTVVFLDGQKISLSQEPFVITQGDHTLKLIIGDYETIKTIQAINGRSYTVNLSLDVDIQETM